VPRSKYLSLQLDNLTHTVIGEFALSLHETLTLLRRTVVKAAVDLALLVLQRHVASENEALLGALFHVGMAGAVVEDETLHAHALHVTFVLHAHDLYHVQIDGLVRNTDGLDGVNNQLGEVVGKLRVHFGAEGSFGELKKQRTLR
jgi:hypothetical protein